MRRSAPLGLGRLLSAQYSGAWEALRALQINGRERRGVPGIEACWHRPATAPRWRLALMFVHDMQRTRTPQSSPVSTLSEHEQRPGCSVGIPSPQAAAHHHVAGAGSATAPAAWGMHGSPAHPIELEHDGGTLLAASIRKTWGLMRR